MGILARDSAVSAEFSLELVSAREIRHQKCVHVFGYKVRRSMLSAFVTLPCILTNKVNSDSCPAFCYRSIDKSEAVRLRLYAACRQWRELKYSEMKRFFFRMQNEGRWNAMRVWGIRCYVLHV